MNEEQNIERIEALLRKGSFAQLSAGDKAFLLEQGIDEQAFRFLALGIGTDPGPAPALPEAMRSAVLEHFDAHAPQSTSANGSSPSATPGKTSGPALRMQIFKYTAIAAVSAGAVISVFFLLDPDKQSLHENVALVKEQDSLHTPETEERAPMLPPPADTLRNAYGSRLSVAEAGAVEDVVAYDMGEAPGSPVPEEVPVPEEEKIAAQKQDSETLSNFKNTDLKGYSYTPSNTIVYADELQRKESSGRPGKEKKSEAYSSEKDEDAKQKNDKQLEEIRVSQSQGPGRTAMPQYPSIEEVANARYKGGYPAFDKFISENLRTPSSRSNYTQIENTVVMEIDINKNGIISRRALVSSPDTQLTREVNLVLDKIPPFTKGKNVTVQIPFRFR